MNVERILPLAVDDRVLVNPRHDDRVPFLSAPGRAAGGRADLLAICGARLRSIDETLRDGHQDARPGRSGMVAVRLARRDAEAVSRREPMLLVADAKHEPPAQHNPEFLAFVRRRLLRRAGWELGDQQLLDRRLRKLRRQVSIRDGRVPDLNAQLACRLRDPGVARRTAGRCS